VREGRHLEREDSCRLLGVEASLVLRLVAMRSGGTKRADWVCGVGRKACEMCAQATRRKTEDNAKRAIFMIILLIIGVSLFGQGNLPENIIPKLYDI
jgi:hypothetical protein